MPSAMGNACLLKVFDDGGQGIEFPDQTTSVFGALPPFRLRGLQTPFFKVPTANPPSCHIPIRHPPRQYREKLQACVAPPEASAGHRLQNAHRKPFRITEAGEEIG